MNMMKAVRIHAYGGPDVLMYEDAPIPVPADGEVVVRVHASSVNPFDCAVRAGYMAGYFNYSFPLILGTDVSGVVESFGAGVNNFAPGDLVYGRAGVTLDGAYAEYVALPATDVAAKPPSLDHTQAASVPHAALTAWQALFEEARLSQGQTVLIHAAAGGVGHIAVQLAQSRGAKVIGTASGNCDFLTELGVDQVINYSTTPFEGVVDKVDVVLDLVGGDTLQRSWALIKPGGMLISAVQAPSQEMADAHGVRQRFIYSSPPIGKVLTEIAGMVEAGQIKPEIATVLPLSEIREAHKLSEDRHTCGKIVLQVLN